MRACNEKPSSVNGTGDYLAALLGPPLLARLSEQETDVVIGPDVAMEAGIERIPLPADPFACLVRTEHPKVKRSLRLPTYLALSHVVVSPTGAGGSIVDRLLSEAGVGPRKVAVWVPSFLLGPQLVAETDLVLTAPRASLLSASRFLPVRIVSAPLPIAPLELCVYVDARRAHEPRSAFIRQLVLAVRREVLIGA